MAKWTVRTEGFRELEANLAELGDRVARKVGQAALRRAGNAILKKTKINVPVDEGRLKEALTLSVERGRHKKSQVYATVKVKPVRDYRPRTTDNITTRKGKRGDWGGSYQVGSTPEVYGAFIEFGAPMRNIAPRGYMRGAWDSEGGEKALKRIGTALGEGIEREAAKLGKG